jgi:ABC-type nickel/cobalt efflux system permease component RcnA
MSYNPQYSDDKTHPNTFMSSLPKFVNTSSESTQKTSLLQLKTWLQVSKAVLLTTIVTWGMCQTHSPDMEPQACAFKHTHTHTHTHTHNTHTHTENE